jgi:hypothetical protein
MGFFMARNLAKHRVLHDSGSPPLLVWNRSIEKATKLVELVGSNGVRVADDPEQIARECDVIIINLANDTVVKSIYDRFKAALEVFYTTVSFVIGIEAGLEFTLYSIQNLCRNQHGLSVVISYLVNPVIISPP